MKTRLLFCFFVLMFVAGIGKANATEYIWVGYDGANWSDAKNWYNLTKNAVNNNYPGSSGTTDIADIGSNNTLGSFINLLLSTIFAGKSYSQPTLDVSPTIATLNFGNLNVVPAVTLTLSSGKTLTVNSSIVENSNTTVTINGPGTIIGTSAVTINGTSSLTSSAAINAATLTFASSTCTLSISSPFTLTGAITVNGTTSITGTGLLKGYNFVGNANTTLSAPLTITTGDITIAQPNSFTSNAGGVINGITFTANYGNAISFGDNITLTGGTASGSSYSMTIPQTGSLTNSASATIQAPSLYLGYAITATINGPVNLSGLLFMQQNSVINAGTSGTISAGNINESSNNTITTSASITVTSGGTLTATTSNITTNGTAATINTPNFFSSSSGTNTFSLQGAATVSTLLTVASGTATFSSSNNSLLSPAAVQVSGATMNVNMPMTVSNAVTTNNNSVINSNTSGVINAGSMSVNGTTFNLQATSTTSGAVTFVSNTSTLNGNPLFKANSVNINGITVNLNEPLTSTNALTTSSGSTLTGNNIAILNAGSMSVTGSTVSLQAVAKTTSSDITFVSGTNLFTNSALTTSAGNVNVQAGTLTLGASSISTPITATGNFTTASGTTFNSYSSAITAAALQVGGSFNLYSTENVTTTSTGYINNGITFSNQANTLDFLGTATITVGGTTAFSYQTNIQIGSSTVHAPTLTFSAGSTINATSNNTNNFYNYGTLNFSGGSAPASLISLNFTQQNDVIYNYSGGVVNAQYTTFKFDQNTSGINNANIFNITGTSPVNLNGYQDYVINNGTFTAGGANSTVTFNLSGQNTNITNSGVFNAAPPGTNSKCTINATGSAPTYIANTGIFNAGASGTACIINLSGQSNENNVSSNLSNIGSSSQNAYFNVGSNSIINLLNGYQANVTNSSNGYSFFTFRSDAMGSASIGQIGATGTVSYSNPPAGFIGTFNVQRYMTGGTSAVARTYRLLSSPTNVSTNGSTVTPSQNNYIDFSNFSTTPSKNTYKVYDHLTSFSTFYGAFTGGTTGFSVSNPNPTMYLYNETLNPTTASTNTTFTSGKNVGLNSISGTTITASGKTNGVPYTVSATSIPVGNGYLMFYIGSINGRASGSTALAPDTAVITNVGNINQQSIPVYLWYAPGGSTLGSGKLSWTTSVTNYQGINMIGNPYASTIDLNKVYSENSNSSGFTSFYELVDANPGQAYVSYNANTGFKSSTTYSSQYVASGQGFLVQATAAGQSITFNEDQKIYNTALLNTTSSPPVLLYAQKPMEQDLSVSPKTNAVVQNNNVLTGLHLKLSADSTTFDECGISFHPDGSDNYNNNDALDLDGISPKVYLSSYKANKIRTSINTLTDYKNGKRIKLYVAAVTDGIYHITLEDLLNIDTINYKVYLIDTKQNDSLDMVHYKTYNFNLTTADTALFSNRFVLAIERIPRPPYNLISFSAQKSGNNAVQLNWKTANEGDYTTFGLEKLGSNGQYTVIDSVQSNGSGEYSYKDLNVVIGNNIYRLAQNDFYGKVTYAGPININFSSNSAGGLFNIYPNPSKDIINVVVNSATTGSQSTQAYFASIYNLSGIEMDSKQVNTNSWTQDVSSYKAGVYILELKTADGYVVGKAKFVKTN